MASQNVASLRRVQIGSLRPGLKNFCVVGIIIAKHESKKVAKKDGSVKYVAQLTIRDTPEDFVAVSFWMDEKLSRQFDDDFHIGDVVELSNLTVSLKNTSVWDKCYEPETSVDVKLTFSDDKSSLLKLKPDPQTAALFSSLLHLPTKPMKQLSTLIDVHSQTLHNTDDFFYVDTLVCVRSVGPVKSFKAKQDEDFQGPTREMREVVVFDCTQSFTIVKLWDFDWIHLADEWQPKKTILCFADLRVNWDSFRCCAVFTATKKTIITFGVVCQESSLLANYARQVDFSWQTKMMSIMENINLGAVTMITTTIGLHRMIAPVPGPHGEKLPTTAEESVVTVIVYGYLTRLNLDGPVERFLINKCSTCGAAYKPDTQISELTMSAHCTNPECSSFQQTHTMVKNFNMKGDLSDCTGTFTNLQMTESVAEELLGPLNNFALLSTEERRKISAKILLEPTKFYLMAIPPSSEIWKSTIMVLRLQQVSMSEFAEKSPYPPIQ